MNVVGSVNDLTMSRLPLLLVLFSSLGLTRSDRSAAWVDGDHYSPFPLEGHVVIHGAARFTVLSQSLLRLEYSPHDPPQFHDAGSFFAVNRRFPKATTYSSSAGHDGSFVLETSQLELRYSPNIHQGNAFSPETLSIKLLASGTIWHPGIRPDGSLHGTIRTLDRVGSTVGLRCTQPAYLNDSHCEEGVVSTDGWAVIDDSIGPRWDTLNYAQSAWPWVTGPAESPASPPGVHPAASECAAQGFDRFECIWGNTVDKESCIFRGCCFDADAAAAANGQHPSSHFVPWCFWPERASSYTDLYFFGHGLNYPAALRDFSSLGGKVPLMPRWALGPHFSRWFAFTDEEEREVLATHARLGVPLDVQVGVLVFLCCLGCYRVVEVLTSPLQVIDTDWHHGWAYERGFPPHPPRFPHGPPPLAHPIPWTGFDVNEAMLPAAHRLHAYLHARGVATGLNLHLPPYVHQSGGVQVRDVVLWDVRLVLTLKGCNMRWPFGTVRV